MSTVLVTGARGFVGSRLIERLEQDHEVIALSRRETTSELLASRGDGEGRLTVRANLTSHEELRALDGHRIDALVHLASEIGGCSEEAGLAVNVLGTRTLVRYLLDRGCKHFVLASSVAAVGCLSPTFVPQQLPIPDDHPCEAADAYGMSKGLMEDLAFYFARQDPEVTCTLFRLGAVLGDGMASESRLLMTETSLPFVEGGGMILLPDAVEAFARAVEQPLGPGARRINLVAESSLTPVPVPQALRQVMGDLLGDLDLSYYEAAGREKASVYATDRLFESFGLRAPMPAPSAAAAP